MKWRPLLGWLMVLGLIVSGGLTLDAQEKKDEKKEEKKEEKKDEKKKDEKKDEKKAPAKKVPADAPFKREDKFAVSRHESFVKRAKEGNVDVLFLGDSITQGWEGAGKDAWKENFEKLKPANFGIGGDRTEHVLWRLTEGKELEGITPKVCVMMIGTNTTGANTAAEIASGVKAIIAELHKQRPDMKVLLLGVFPRSGKGNPKEATQIDAKDLQPKIGEINQIISKYDDGKKVFYLDIGKSFLDKDGNLPREIMPDFLHLSPKGYQLWAGAIKEKLAALLK
jgi:lysophospholipase L1-like esterase